MTQSTYRRPAVGERRQPPSTSFPSLLPQNGNGDEERTSYPGWLIPPAAGSPSSYARLIGAPHLSGCAGTFRSIT
jgi:hypothetical protein